MVPVESKSHVATSLLGRVVDRHPLLACAVVALACVGSVFIGGLLSRTHHSSGAQVLELALWLPALAPAVIVAFGLPPVGRLKGR